MSEKSRWDTADGLDSVAGTLAAQYPRLKQEMLRWSACENIWLRRAAIDFQQRYKEKTDTALLEQIIRNNLGTRAFFIDKAIGWNLREYGKADPKGVRGFLARYRDELSALSAREAGKYL